MTLWHLALAELLPLIALWAAELSGRRAWFWVAKPLASLVFVVAGALFLPWPETSSSFLFAGLLLAATGDVLLVPKGRRTAFLFGLASFLCAHLAYGVAFIARGVAAPAALGATLIILVGSVPILRWLLPHVRGSMRGPVMGYVLAIGAMVALALGAWGAGAVISLPMGAVLFFVSDLCVARERFVTRSRWNGFVGLPLYYVAQLLLVHGMGRAG